MKKLCIIIVLLSLPILVLAQDWNSSPNNWENSASNWENSSSNWDNSPNNWDNSPQRYGNDRIVRDNQGNAAGYIVHKRNGGANIYDKKGNRKAYIPPKNPSRIKND